MFIEWQNNQAATMRCSNKWQETDDAVSITLVAADASHLHFSNFKPGQFVSLGFELNGKMEYRAYSIASAPGDAHLKLTVKRVDGGLVSNHIVDHFNCGDTVAVLAPTGPFNTIDCPPKQKVTLISAGCGITPVMSMACTWLRDKADIDIVFIHMAKSAAKTIYFDQLESMAAAHSNFHLKLLLKDNAGTRHPQGRLDKAWLNTLCPDLAERTVYLCGPTQFMQDMESHSRALGVEDGHFHQESFTPMESKQSETSSAAVQVEVPAFGVTAEVAQGSTLADVLEENGVPIIIACRSGMCGSCKCKVTKGTVSRTSTETLSEEDLANGYTLACSSQIESNVEVELV
ncbi:oxidoreductase [Vibrio caribbeanicus]|uniref:Oxidoreductase n=1 Tax=Vibrio caribbeanicus TaxID=701175 RepID=A0ACC4NZS1_9VIBR|nr:hybrid-cluster NAD(P)-dependent oxidoreductase [Vibrio caribbeanicus]KHD25871.1 oxidoreductase [Vibrio caribbeanicus]